MIFHRGHLYSTDIVLAAGAAKSSFLSTWTPFPDSWWGPTGKEFGLVNGYLAGPRGHEFGGTDRPINEFMQNISEPISMKDLTRADLVDIFDQVKQDYETRTQSKESVVSAMASDNRFKLCQMPQFSPLTMVRLGD